MARAINVIMPGDFDFISSMSLLKKASRHKRK
jgi:hypothetical protein